MLFQQIGTFLIVTLTVAYSCVSGSCKNGMCSDIPADNTYYLTSFCDKSVACGSFSGNCNEYYAADYSRFGCNSVISCCRGSDCVNLKVIDGGPGCSVEDSAHKQIVDASYSTCKHFTGSTSCGKWITIFTTVCLCFLSGWSDKISVKCTKVKASEEDILDVFGKPSLLGGRIPLGPCSFNATFAADNKVRMCDGSV